VGVEDAGVVAAWAFAGGVIIVGVGVSDARDTNGPETAERMFQAPVHRHQGTC
jgi:hypothetical protein